MQGVPVRDAWFAPAVSTPLVVLHALEVTGVSGPTGTGIWLSCIYLSPGRDAGDLDELVPNTVAAGSSISCSTIRRNSIRGSASRG